VLSHVKIPQVANSQVAEWPISQPEILTD
jgi:hypothetical protein